MKVQAQSKAKRLFPPSLCFLSPDVQNLTQKLDIFWMWFSYMSAFLDLHSIYPLSLILTSVRTGTFYSWNSQQMLWFSANQFSSVAQSCPMLCNPMGGLNKPWMNVTDIQKKKKTNQNLLSIFSTLICEKNSGRCGYSVTSDSWKKVGKESDFKTCSSLWLLISYGILNYKSDGIVCRMMGLFAGFLCHCFLNIQGIPSVWKYQLWHWAFGIFSKIWAHNLSSEKWPSR